MTAGEDRDLDALLGLAKQIAAEAAAVHRRGLGRKHTVGTKSSPTDLISEVDREAEKLIVQAIRRARPDDAIVAEEGSEHQGASGLRWLVDPLDGTVNFVYGYPGFTVSIGIEIDGRPAIGVVHDSFHDHVYAGIMGRGSERDGLSLQVNTDRSLPEALVATGFSYSSEHRRQQGQWLAALLPRVRDIRRSGSAALDLCLLAAGRVDAYWEAGIRAWDVTGGAVIAAAAGAQVVTFRPKTGPTPLVVAAHSALARTLIDLLCEAGAIGPTDPRIDLICEAGAIGADDPRAKIRQ